ncbi:MAG: hypothetical protein JWM88_1287, partial [Verrucomicrobia bacterium]|nr:hypothetical protein [Verrucomicrobiota bacterium]
MVLAAVFASAVRADVLPPAQDTYSTAGKLTVLAGKSPTLVVSAASNAYVLFDVDGLPKTVLPADVVSARLRVFFPATVVAGAVEVHAVASAGALWNE